MNFFIGLKVKDVKTVTIDDVQGYEVTFEDNSVTWFPFDVISLDEKLLVKYANGLFTRWEDIPGGAIMPAEFKTKVVNLSFGEALDAMKGGHLVARKNLKSFTWFVCKQIPSEIPNHIIPNMQSLPDKAKKALEEYNLYYKNQLLIVEHDGTATAYMPSTDDMFANDWYIVEV